MPTIFDPCGRARRIFRLAVALPLLLNLTGGAVAAPYLAVDLATGAVLAENQSFDPWYPASITKLMTVYVTLSAIKAGEIRGDSGVVMTPASTREQPSKMGFKPGTVLTVDTALRIIMVKSANDVSYALAERVGGSLQGFVARMNAAARSVGMVNTRFSNANGLPDPQPVDDGTRLRAACPHSAQGVLRLSGALPDDGAVAWRQDHQESQQSARALSRRRRNEDRLHLLGGLQCGGDGDPQRPTDPRHRAWRQDGAGARRTRGQPARSVVPNPRHGGVGDAGPACAARSRGDDGCRYSRARLSQAKEGLEGASRRGSRRWRRSAGELSCAALQGDGSDPHQPRAAPATCPIRWSRRSRRSMCPCRCPNPLVDAPR